MPTTPGIPSTPLDTKQAAEKFAGLIVESGVDEPPETDAAAAPVEAAAEKPAPPEPPPQSSDTEPVEESADDPVFDIDGEQVSLSELKKARLRQDDYTRKTQALADERKTLEASIVSRVERENLDRQAQYVQGLVTLEQALGELQAEPQRGSLSDAEYMKAMADYHEAKQNRQRLKDHQEAERQKLTAAQQKQYQDFVRAEYDKLVVAIPEWSETEKAKSDISKLKGFAKKQYGFDDVAINNGFSTAAIVLLIRDAMQYHDLKREPSPQVKAKVAPIKTAKPGTPARPRPNEKQTKLIEQVAKTGRQRDAMAAIEAMLE